MKERTRWFCLSLECLHLLLFPSIDPCVTLFAFVHPGLCSYTAQVFERSRPWYCDVSIVKVAITDPDDEEKCRQCLAVRQLHYEVTMTEESPIGSLVVHVQLQQSSYLAKVCINLKFKISFISA